MSLNSTPSSERTHIGIFGRRNAGKSSLINALTGQNLAIVSDVQGTTTDPVLKAMELLPLGPIVMIDTPGLDDEGELGKLRIQKAYQVLNKTDIAVLVIDGTTGFTTQDEAILNRIQDKNIPLLLIFNKSDMVPESVQTEMVLSAQDKYQIAQKNILWVNTTEKHHIYELKEQLARLVPSGDSSRFIVGKGGEPDFLSDKNGLLVGKIKGYQDVQVGKKAIYTLFSGTDHQEELKKMMKGQPTPDGGNLFLVYDLDGKLIRKFLLDHYTNGIDVHEDSNILYTVSSSEENAINKYRLPL